MKLIAIFFALFLLCGSGLAQATAPAERAFQKASEALRAGDYVAAESGFNQVLRLEPANISAMGNLGVVYTRTHRFALAINIYKRALRLSPADSGILLNAGLAYLKQNDYKNGATYFRQLHARDPGNLQAAN